MKCVPMKQCGEGGRNGRRGKRVVCQVNFISNVRDCKLGKVDLGIGQ